MNADKRR